MVSVYWIHDYCRGLDRIESKRESAAMHPRLDRRKEKPLGTKDYFCLQWLIKDRHFSSA